MQRGNLSKWTNIPACINLLFFSQLVNEQLFDYSIPSNRVATLNSHYLCMDAIDAIGRIEDNCVPEGTLKPIMEELYTSLSKDPVFGDEDSPLRLFVKYQDGRYTKCNNISSLNYHELREIAWAIHSRYFEGQDYLNALTENISDLIKENNEATQPELFRMTKSLLTELTNAGYSLKYIFYIANEILWNPSSEISSPEVIDTFFRSFQFESRSYEVVFIVNPNKVRNFVESISSIKLLDNIQPKTRTQEEKNFLDKENNKKFLQMTIDDIDPFSASEKAMKMIDIYASIYRMYDHYYRYDIHGVRCGVYCENGFYRIRRAKNPTFHVKMPTRVQITKNVELATSILRQDKYTSHTLHDYLTLLNAASFHAQALSSSSPENQLLDFWAIFEAILDISNEHTGDRIQQVCKYLVPILKRRYLYSLFKELGKDIKNYSEEKYNIIIGGETEDAKVVQKVAEFIILPENDKYREDFLNGCVDYPLMKERVDYYNKMLNSPRAVYDFVEKHASRVRWQIMRIYRNRNLIIHNGQSMPYLELLIENLHNYIDDFLEYSFKSISDGHSIESMGLDLFAKECDWVSCFSTNSKGKVHIPRKQHNRSKGTACCSASNGIKPVNSYCA